SGSFRSAASSATFGKLRIRASIVVGLLVSIASFVISAILGAIAGFYGGWVDAIISRVGDIAFGLPFILAAIVILPLFPERSI
ncbi:hypothetical protein KCW65_29280, partial [Mycobacterium tuberculosis]|nr:hypothetical protein [Mycobacterium tuberculosis]